MEENKSDRDNAIFRQAKHSLPDMVYTPDAEPLSALIHSLPLNVFAKDRHGKFIFANDFYCKNIGKTYEELIGKDEYEDIIITVGKAMLKKLGYCVITAESGEQAVNIVSETKNKIDLMILDLIMPGMDGSKTFNKIREIRPDLPVILSSGYSINGQAADILKRGANSFIQKPFDLSRLSQVTRNILDTQ
jgi:CheY-like chemotaxis protein